MLQPIRTAPGATTQAPPKPLNFTRTTPNVPSRLAQQLPPPLTPAIEEVKTPGGTLSTPANNSGFFSSMFSAAQNAASQISNTITSTSGPKGKGGAESSEQDETAGEEVIFSSPEQTTKDPSAAEKRQLAIETLGTGNLSLSHLGITESVNHSPMSSKVDVSSLPPQAALRHDEMTAKAEDNAAARAVSLAYSEKTNGEKPARSTAGEQSVSGNQTPQKVEPETSSILRAGSVRSRLSGGRRRRTRGSSSATGTTAVAGNVPGVSHRQTGFAVANPKRNRDFHNQFKSVPEDDYLIEDYSAALQREILLQGRLYISEGHVCFSSNIFGWVTNLVIGFDEIISVEKRSTAVIFQNGMIIQTLHARNVLASLITRDATYDLIVSMWKTTHPHLKSSLNGVPVEAGGTGDKTEKAESAIEDDSASEEVYDENEEETEDDGDGDGSFVEATEPSAAVSEAGDAGAALTRKISSQAIAPVVQGGSAKVTDHIDAGITGAAASVDFPGPATHDPTDCGGRRHSSRKGHNGCDHTCTARQGILSDFRA